MSNQQEECTGSHSRHQRVLPRRQSSQLRARTKFKINFQKSNLDVAAVQRDEHLSCRFCKYSMYLKHDQGIFGGEVIRYDRRFEDRKFQRLWRRPQRFPHHQRKQTSPSIPQEIGSYEALIGINRILGSSGDRGSRYFARGL